MRIFCVFFCFSGFIVPLRPLSYTCYAEFFRLIQLTLRFESSHAFWDVFLLLHPSLSGKAPPPLVRSALYKRRKRVRADRAHSAARQTDNQSPADPQRAHNGRGSAQTD